MTAKEFEERYCRDSGITLELYASSFVTRPCHCDYKFCKGWSAVSNHPLALKAYKDLYEEK